MTILDRYVCREMINTCLFGLGLFSTLLVANHVFYVLRVATQFGAPVAKVLPLIALHVPFLIGFGMPMATLLGTILCFSRMSEAREIDAMRTSGVSLARIAVPVVIVGALVAGANYLLNEQVSPLTEDLYRVRHVDLVRPSDLGIRRNILFREQTSGGSEIIVFARVLDPKTESLRDVTLSEYRGGRLYRVIEASRARWDRASWLFLDGQMNLFQDFTVSTTFDQMRLSITRPPAQLSIAEKTTAEMSRRELEAYIRGLGAGEAVTRRRLLVDLYNKEAMPAASLPFALLGLALGLVPVRSGSRSIGFGLTVVALIFYYILATSAGLLGSSGVLSPMLAAWLPNIILALVGVAITYVRR
ncbi:MAG: YjgP/YjgQ family permease [Armatimonadetes bacterium]|nr:YjgP/YjgQ family permease [Armatimonadota bacterium]